MADSNKKLIQRGVSSIEETETAINEKAREEYVEAQDAVTLEVAKAYTDEQVATCETPAGAQDKADAAAQVAQEAAITAAAAHSDTALKAHTDTVAIHKTSEQIRAEIVDADIPATLARVTAVDTKDAATLEAAKGYTDTKVAALVDGAPETLDTLKEIAEVLKANEDGAAAMLEVIGTKADAAATVAALAEKVDKEEGKGLSSNDYTSAEREKLAGLDSYTLPAATAATLGGVKIGDNLTVDVDGRLCAPAGGGGTVTVSPDAGNTLEQRENGLFVPAGSGGSDGGGDISGIEIGTQNMVPAATLFTRTLDSAAEMQEMLPILADPSVMGDGTNRAFAMGEVPFVGRYITVDQPMASFAPGWQIVVFGFNPMNGATFDTYTKESNQWPEVYPKTYDLGEETLFVLGFILRKDNNTALDLEELATPLFVVNRGNKTIGAASQYQPYPVLPVMPQILQSNIICTVQDGKFTGATNPPGGEVTILHYNVDDTGDEMIVYIQLKSNNYRATLTAYSFEEVYTEVTQGNMPGSSYPVPALRIKIKTSIAKYTSGIALFFSYWAPGA